MDLATLLLTCAPAIDPSTMAAVVITESNGHPYALHDNETGRSYWPKTSSAAIKHAKELDALGHSLDVGLGQINTGNFKRLNLDFEAAFDPCTNLTAAAALLMTDYLRTDHDIPPKDRLTQTLSRYNTGSPKRGVANGYVGRVVNAAHQKMIPPISVLTPDSVNAKPDIPNNPDVFDSIPDGFE